MSEVLSQDFSSPADLQLNIQEFNNDLSSSTSSSIASTIPIDIEVDNSERENPVDITSQRLTWLDAQLFYVDR